MPKYSRKKSKQKPNKLLLVVPFLLVVVLVGSWFVMSRREETASTDTSSDQPTTEETINYEPPSEEEKQETDENVDKTKTAEPEPKPVTTNNGSVKVVKVWQTSGSDVVVQGSLSGSSWETCRVTFKKGDSTLAREAPVIYQPDYSTCEGFTIKGADFPSSGSWTVTLTGIRSDGSTMTSASKKVDVSIEP